MKSIAIIDLDGTLISNNSFTVWLKVLTITSLKKFDLFVFFKILIIVTFRFLNVYDRTKMKSLLLKISSNKKYDSIGDIVALRCKPFLRQNLIDEIIKHKFDYIVIASAAPLFYLDNLIKRANIPANEIIGSKYEGDLYFECSGENKKLSVSNIKQNLGVQGEIYFYTDHYEDLPTATIVDKVFLVGPNELTVNYFNKSNIKYTIFS